MQVSPDRRRIALVAGYSAVDEESFKDVLTQLREMQGLEREGVAELVIGDPVTDYDSASTAQIIQNADHEWSHPILAAAAEVVYRECPAQPDNVLAVSTLPKVYS